MQALTLPDDTRGGAAITLALASILLFLPSAIRYVSGASSNALGLTLSCALIIGAAALHRFDPRYPFARRMTFLSVVAAAFVGMHLVVAVLLPPVVQLVDVSRTLGSFVAIIVCSATAGIIAQWLWAVSADELDRVGKILIFVLLLISIWCFVGFQPPSYMPLTRPSFPFTEPSHFALVAAPFIMDSFVRTTLAKRFLWLAAWLALAYVNQSTSLIVVLMLTAFVGLRLPYAIAAAVIVTAIALQLDLKYYLERIDFSTESGNLSALVYRQGWELMSAGLDFSNGWGIGFQQLGYTTLNVPTSDLIYRLLNDDSNLRDGSFLAAKIISELGVVGFAIIAFCLYCGIRGAIVLRKIATQPVVEQDSRLRFAASVLVAFQVELFVRGIGYFSSTAVLFIAAVIVFGMRSNLSVTGPSPEPARA